MEINISFTEQNEKRDLSIKLAIPLGQEVSVTKIINFNQKVWQGVILLRGFILMRLTIIKSKISGSSPVWIDLP